jgi:hypothetical protein
MHIVYLDDSRDATFCIVTALIIPEASWKQVFDQMKVYRSNLKRTEGLFTRKEWHATDFVSGRGRIADRTIPKGRRCHIFSDSLRLLGGMKPMGISLINACLPRKEDLRAYERTLNRINVAMREESSRALLIWDTGKEGEHRRLARKMAVFNMIPSKFGEWSPGQPTKNIPLDRIIEDPVFKDSADSYFLQWVDFCAFALLRRESPLASRSKYGLDTAFASLAPLLNIDASDSDPEGIIR